MHRLAHLTDQERRRLISEFIDTAFDGIDVGPEFTARMRAGMPELPDDPTTQQFDAWVELAELVQNEDFRASLRRAAADQAAAGARDDGAPDASRQPDAGAARRLATYVRERTAVAREAGVAPDSSGARPFVGELTRAYAEFAGCDDTPQFRTWLLRRLEDGHEPRFERYWHLVAVINGRPTAPDLSPAVAWLAAALRATGTS